MVQSQALNTALISVFSDWIKQLSITDPEFCDCMARGPLLSLTAISENQLRLFKKFTEASDISAAQVLDDYLYCKNDPKYGLGFFLTQRALNFKLTNHPGFDGLSFSHGDSWAKCSIFKKGLSHPIEVTEFKEDHDLTKAEHPIRTLRSIALQQAAELFGIRTAYFCERRLARVTDEAAPVPALDVPVFAKEPILQAAVVVVSEPDNDLLNQAAAFIDQAPIELNQPVELPAEIVQLIGLMAKRAIELKNPHSVRHFLLGELKDMNLNDAQIEKSLMLFDHDVSKPLGEVNAQEPLPDPATHLNQIGEGVFMDNAVLTLDGVL